MHLYIFFLSLRNRTELLKSGTMLEEILAYNKQFVENKGYESYITNKYPDKKIAILSCMDTRLTALLPAALGIKNGDVKAFKSVFNEYYIAACLHIIYILFVLIR